jgi:pimeloyl-ACP methyl ester carboxylesterase
MPGRLGAAIATLIALSWLCCFAISQAKAGQFVKVSDDLELFYEDVGQGPPIVLVPGWTASGVVFSQQIDHFSKSYRVITYDPRSQGLSTRTLDHNDYAQYGRDLAALVCIDMPPRGMSTDPSDWATPFSATEQGLVDLRKHMDTIANNREPWRRGWPRA